MSDLISGVRYNWLNYEDGPFACDSCSRAEDGLVCNFHENCDACGGRHTTCEGCN